MIDVTKKIWQKFFGFCKNQRRGCFSKKNNPVFLFVAEHKFVKLLLIYQRFLDIITLKRYLFLREGGCRFYVQCFLL